MKVALCLYGLVGSKVGKNGVGENIDPQIGFDYYKKHLLDKNVHVDVFIHSWSIEEKDKLISLYEPKKYCIERQSQFPQAINHPLAEGGVRSKLKMAICRFMSKGNYVKLKEQQQKMLFRAYSRWFSSKKVLELKKQYEDENNFKYDCVMISRMDIAFFTDVIFDRYDMNYFYASHWNGAPIKENDFKGDRLNRNKGKGFLDFWFFSNSDNMDKFSLLYDNIEQYDPSPHISSRQHADTFTDKIRYVYYRWFDYEMIRRKIYECKL